MSNVIISTNLIKKINSFLKNANSLKYLDPNIFETIDKYKEINNITYNEYFLEYIANLPKLDFESAVKISREVYQLYGKEQEFDKILEKMISHYSIGNGSLNPNDKNNVFMSSEDEILLSGTYYDVVLLCHEIGHKLKYDNLMQPPDIIMASFLLEAPSIVFEFAASDYVRDNYGVDINAEELRKIHVLSSQRYNSIKNNAFLVVIKLLKERKFGIINLYRNFIEDPMITEYLSGLFSSIENLVVEGIEDYSYDIGYILGRYINNSDNKIELLNTLLKYEYKGLDTPFTINDDFIKDIFECQKYTK